VRVSELGLARIESSTVESIKKAIAKSLELIGYGFPAKAEKVVVKPNLCYYLDCSTGQTTDPKFVAALIELIRERIALDVDISVVESDASAMKCRHSFKMLGYKKLSRDYNVKLVNLSEGYRQPARVEIGDRTFTLMIPHTIREAHLRINVPKIKYTIENIKITCALKNIFGCNPYPKKFKYHPWLEESIVAMNKAMPFDLCLVDGNIAAGSGTARLGLVMAGVDPVAVDAASSKIAGVRPNSIRYLRLAEREGLGNMTFAARGTPLDYFKARYPRKKPREKLVGKTYDLLVRTGIAGMLRLGQQ